MRAEALEPHHRELEGDEPAHPDGRRPHTGAVVGMVLLCTAAVPSSLRALATSQGANVRLMFKPFDLDELLGTVQSMLASRTALPLQ